MSTSVLRRVMGLLLVVGLWCQTFAKTPFHSITGISPTSGPTAGGTVVTITGTGLNSPTAVMFGTTAATSFSGNSDSQITATSPAGTGTVHITVTAEVGGTSATSAADQFTYTAPTAILTVNVNTNVGGTATGGGALTVGSTNQIAAVSSNGWVFTGWSDGSQANPRKVVVPATNSTYTANFALGTINVYVANWSSQTIERFDASGSNLGVFVSTGFGPYGMDFDSSNNLYVASYYNNNVTRYSPSGSNLGVFASTGMNGPYGLAFDGSGNLYAANYLGNNVTRYNSSGSNLGVFASAGMNRPYALVFDDSGKLYVANSEGNNVTHYDSSGGDLGVFASAGINRPQGLAFDGNGNLNVANWGNNNVTRYSASGSNLGVFASTGLDYPCGMAFDGGGHLYVANLGGGNVMRYNASDSNQGVFASAGLSAPVNVAIQTILQSRVGAVANPANGGSVDGGGVYAIGDTAALTATASNGWAFTGWSDGATNNPYTLTVPATNSTCTANFAPVPPTVLAATNVTVNRFSAHWTAVEGATNYLLDVATGSEFTSYVAGYSNLSVGVATSWPVVGLTPEGGTFYYRVRQQQADLTSTSSLAMAVQLLTAGLSPCNGPALGGNTVTITGTGLGAGADITNVTVCGVAATILSQTADAVTVQVGAGGAGTGDVVVSSASRGMTTLAHIYTYNPAGYIYGANEIADWQSISNLPVAVALVHAASLNGQIYAIGGFSDETNGLNTVYTYNPLQPTLGWQSVSNLPIARRGAGLAATGCNGALYAIGGISDETNALNTVFAYDPLQPTLGWQSISNMPEAKVELAAASCNGKLYVFGGASSPLLDDSANTVYVYDPLQPTLGWQSISSLPEARRGLAAASCNGKLYVFGGLDINKNILATVLVYDPLNPGLGWQSISNMPEANTALVAASCNGKLYVYGGMRSCGFVYDPVQPMLGWRSLNTPFASVILVGGASLSNQLFAVGGVDSDGPQSAAYQSVTVSGVAPAVSPLAGGTTVTITGQNLGAGDVTSVTLCGVVATVVTDHSPTQLVVTTGLSAAAVTGDVVVVSTSYGTTVASKAFSYAIAVSAAPAQLFFQSGVGLVASWVLVTNGTFESARALGSAGAWQLLTAGDVDGDGVSDLLFQDAAGNTAGWLLDSTGTVRSVISFGNAGRWEVRACADYAGEGHAQLFFQNASGLVALWHIDTNGTFQSAEMVLINASDWRLSAASPHVTGGRADLYWQNAAGLVVVWQQQAGGGVLAQVVGNADAWVLCGATDVDGDGVGDLLWQAPDGNTAGWFMSSTNTARACLSWGYTGDWKLKAGGQRTRAFK